MIFSDIKMLILGLSFLLKNKQLQQIQIKTQRKRSRLTFHFSRHKVDFTLSLASYWLIDQVVLTRYSNKFTQCTEAASVEVGSYRTNIIKKQSNLPISYFSKLTDKKMNQSQAIVTTRVVVLHRVLLGIASYTEQNLAIRSRLYRV